MADLKCILVIRAGNKVLFQKNKSEKYELISAEQGVSPDKIEEYVCQTYKLHITDCQEMPSHGAPQIRTYYICTDKPESDPPYGQKWFTLQTAVGKLSNGDPYGTIRNFLHDQAELSMYSCNLACGKIRSLPLGSCLLMSAV